MPDVRMNYDSMERMAKAFHAAHQQIETSMREMQKVSKQMEEGALQGGGGNAFREAINSKLLKRMNVLKEKMQELEGDVQGAVFYTRDGVKNAQSRFKN